MTYRPIVRTKVGETEAIGELSQIARRDIAPIVNLTTSVPASFAQNLINRMPDVPIALDGSFNFSENGTPAAFTALASNLGNAGISLIPSIQIGSAPAYVNAALSIVGQFGQGLVLRCPIGDLNILQNWINVHNVQSNNVDLVIDAGGVAEHDPVTFGAYAAHAIQADINPGMWRSVTLYSHAAPRDHGALNYGRNLVPRRDWLLWSHVRQLLAFNLEFSDCGHVHPSLEEVPGYAMASATVSARYTIDNNWIIYKGVRTSGQNGLPMRSQYQSHARALIAEPEFNNINGCWADDRIRHYAATTDGTGNRGNWAAVSLNRHISHVVDRLP